MDDVDNFSVDAARRANERGELGGWVERFLASDGSDNAELGQQLRSEQERWVGPVEVSFDHLHRLAGPPDQPTLERLTERDLETVDAMADSIDDGWTPSPLIATFADDHLVLEDGNHRVEGLRRAGADRYWTVIGFDDGGQQHRFDEDLRPEVVPDDGRSGAGIPGESPPGADADDPTEIPLAGWRQIARRVAAEFKADHVTLSASGVAFHAFLALVPLIAAAVSIYGLLADPSNVERLVDRLGSAVPDAVSELINTQLDAIVTADQGALGVGAVFGIVLGLWAASSGVSYLIEALNIAYDEDTDSRPFWKKRGLAIALTLLIMTYLTTAATLVAAAGSLRGSGGSLAMVAAWLAVVALLGVVLAVFYRYSTDRDEPEWVWVSPGSIFTVVTWTAASFLFGVYARNFGSYNETYGALGAIVVVLLWLFISATVIIIGAEINAEIERQTLEDSTSGRDRPIGLRDADAADSIPS